MLTISYASTRREVWKFYWRAWARPAGFWRVHVLLGFLGALTWRSPGSGGAKLASFLLTWLAGTLVCVLVLPLWPQLLFKPEPRILSIDESGWTTQIGTRRGARAWKQVLSIDDDGEVITITGTNGNGLIVPRRAFHEEAQRQEFLASARAWHAQRRA